METKKPIKEEDFAIEHIRLAVSKKYFNKELYNKYGNSRMIFIMKLDNNAITDLIKNSSIAKYINLSCEPNCKVEV